MMNKIQFWDDQEELLRSAGQMTALIENDRHVKSASANSITRELLEANRPDKDHFLLHVIALGDHEHFGANRNGDAFPKAACEKYHPTFVSHGHYFREHRNRDPKLAIGNIKAACYNAPMGRVELAVWGHVKKAEDVLQKLKDGKPIGNSMSCRVPEDRSSITGKLARTPADYDEYCKYRMNQYIPEFRKFAFVFNDRPTFFDISDVKNPADRIAYTLDSMMPKAASAGRPVSGAALALAEGVLLPEPARCSPFQSLIEKLAAWELRLDMPDTTAAGQFAKYAAVHAAGELTEEQLALLKTMSPGALFRKLASRQIVLPFVSFAAYATGRTVAQTAADPAVHAARAQLPHIFTKLAASPAPAELEELCAPASEFLAAADLGSGPAADRLIAKLAADFSLAPHRVAERVLRRTALTGPVPPVKSASHSGESDTLAGAYACYQLSAMSTIQSLNKVESDEPRNILVLSHNRSQM